MPPLIEFSESSVKQYEDIYIQTSDALPANIDRYRPDVSMELGTGEYDGLDDSVDGMV
jgi:hypothetical protein